MTDQLPAVQQLHPTKHIDEVAAQWSDQIMRTTKWAMEQLAPNGVLPESPEQSAEIFAVVRRLRLALAETESLVESHLVNMMKANAQKFVVLEDNTYELHGGTTAKKWEGDKVVAALLLVAKDQGWDLEDFARAVTAASGIDNASHKWRMQKLGALGLNPSDFCETTQGRARIEVI